MGGCSGGPQRELVQSSTDLKTISAVDQTYIDASVGQINCDTGVDEPAELIREGTVIADLNQDGANDAVYFAVCISSAGRSPQFNYVSLSGPGEPYTYQALDMTTLSVRSAYFENGSVFATFDGWSDSAPSCCSDLLVTYSYTWKNGGLRTVVESSVPTDEQSYESDPIDSPIYQDGFNMGYNFARYSPTGSDAKQICATARDRHIIVANGIPQYINNVMNQRVLASEVGFKGCIAGFKSWK